MKSKSSYYLYIGAIVVVVALIGFAVTKEKAPSVYDQFAQCLSEKGVIMYGAWWCPHCENQKQMFGSSFEFVNYIECSLPNRAGQTEECAEAGIEGYPTWEFADGERLSGEQSFETLAKKSGCALPEQS